MPNLCSETLSASRFAHCRSYGFGPGFDPGIHLGHGPRRWAAAAALALLFGCGGEDTDREAAPAGISSAGVSISQEVGAPAASNVTATDGLAWFNYRRQQIGLKALARNPLLDRAAQSHSDYQRLNDVVSHEQTVGAPGYTGAELGQRLTAAGYAFSSNRYAYGEVISATGSASGFAAAEDLITAIYHRFVIFEPTFSEAGGGAASKPGSYVWFTANFAANGLSEGLGRGNLVTYPRDRQQNVLTNFFSDREIPDPVPDRNEVGFPVSVHADVTSTVTVNRFNLRARGASAAVSVKVLSRASDPEVPKSAASIVPLEPLSRGTTYDVQFEGSVDGAPVSRSWSFTTY